MNTQINIIEEYSNLYRDYLIKKIDPLTFINYTVLRLAIIENMVNSFFDFYKQTGQVPENSEIVLNYELIDFELVKTFLISLNPPKETIERLRIIEELFSRMEIIIEERSESN